MTISERIKNRKDRADAVLTTVLLSIPLLVICFAFATGISMQLWQKQAYTTAAQSAVTSALQKPDTSGYLGINAMQEFVNQYLSQTGRTGSSFSLGGPANDQFVANNAFGAAETGGLACTVANIPGIGERQLPYIEMTLDITRNSEGNPATYEYISEGTTGNIIAPAHGVILPGEQYRVLNATVYEATRNVTAFGVGNGFGGADENNCVVVGTSVSAILFGNQEDLLVDQACPQPDMVPLEHPKVQQINATPTIVKTSPLAACTTTVANLSKYEIVTVLGTYRTWSYVELPDGSNGWLLTSRLEDPDAWTINIDYDGGAPTTPNPTTYDWSIDEGPIILAPATKEYTSFAGYQQVNCALPSQTLGAPMLPTVLEFGIYGNLCFKAVFQLQSFNVTWDRNGGTGGGGGVTVSYQYGSEITVPGAATWTGRTFNGWFTAPSGGTQVTNSPKPIMGGANVTYYAQWYNTPYTISYNYEGGTGSPVGASTYTFSTSAQTVNVGGAARACYTFNGWSTTKGTVSGNQLSLPANTTGNAVLTASWTAASNSITYSTAGGSGTISSITSYTISSSPQTIALTVPTRTGYTFNGWTVTGGSATVSGNTLTIPANSCGAVSVTAKWQAQTYTITYQCNGRGTCPPSGAPTTYTYGSTPNIPNATGGGTFDGWTVNVNNRTNMKKGTNVISPTQTGNVTLYAHWTWSASESFSYGASFNWSKWCSGSCNAYVSWSWSCPSGGSWSGGAVQFYDNYANAYRTPWRYEQSHGGLYVASTNTINRVSAVTSGGTCSGTRAVNKTI